MSPARTQPGPPSSPKKPGPVSGGRKAGGRLNQEEIPKIGRGFLCSGLGKRLCYRRGNLREGNSRGGDQQNRHKQSFTDKAALPESKSLTAECKRSGLENAGLARKERGGRGVGSYNLMMSGSHPKCGALTWTLQKKKKKNILPKHLLHPPTRVGLGRGCYQLLPVHPAKGAPDLPDVASDPGLSWCLLSRSLSKPSGRRQKHQHASCHQVNGPWPRLCDASSQWPGRAHTPRLLHPP